MGLLSAISGMWLSLFSFDISYNEQAITFHLTSFFSNVFYKLTNMS